MSDSDKLVSALSGGDMVAHVAALKQAGTDGFNPIECIATIVIAEDYIFTADIDSGVQGIASTSLAKMSLASWFDGFS